LHIDLILVGSQWFLIQTKTAPIDKTLSQNTKTTGVVLHVNLILVKVSGS